MRALTFIPVMGMTMLLLGCGLFGSGEEDRGEVESLMFSERTPGTSAPSPESERSSETERPVVAASVAYDGPRSMEQRIIDSPVIVRVRLNSVSSTVESAVIFDGSTKYIALLEFNFRVQEYLKGSGADDIVAVWAAAPLFETRQEAEDALPSIAAARDSQWDNREAIIFLQASTSFLTSTEQVDRYYLAWGGSWTIPDDGYSIASIHDKLWLPAVDAPPQATGEQQRFLTDVPPATGMAVTITLGEIKTRIAGVATKLAAGAGSEEYAECVQLSYRYDERNRYRIQTEEKGYFRRIPDQEVGSGLAASSVVFEDTDYGDLPNARAETWFDGGDADLFSVEFGDAVPWDSSGDGTNDSISYARRVTTTRPLYEGTYEFQFNHRAYFFVLCEGYASRFEWTVTVNAPEGTLHEAFFDPVTVGTAVAADSNNGVLKPAPFTDTNGASATLERIAWEPGEGDSGTVKLKLTPINGITNHTLDFIALDGSVRLSLKVADATVDAANRTLSWTVASPPWQSGDLFMVRVRKGCESGMAVTNPGFFSDCEALLSSRDALRGTGSLNWDADTAMSSWEGITIAGTPNRVTKVELPNKALSGHIPSSLGSLVELTHLDLSGNVLMGEIPSDLGELKQLAQLKLTGNTLSGCVPVALRDVEDHDLTTLGIPYCDATTPAPEGLSVSVTNGVATISWTAVKGAVEYRVQYKASNTEDEWAELDAVTDTSQQLGRYDGPTCESNYDFRVQAYGDGISYVANWGGASDTVSNATGACNFLPEFTTTSHNFSVAESASTGDVVGTLSATDLDEEDTLSYSISGGNEEGKFSLDASSGIITVAASLDYETIVSYTLTAEVNDGNGGTATTSVEIRVTDVSEVTPPVPRGLEADLRIRASSFDLSWNTVNGADEYRIQYRIDGSAGKWTNLEATTGTSQRFTPEGGIRCSTPHEFRVQAHGDGETHPARWGSRSHRVRAALRGCIYPHAPTGLTATRENGSVVLTWTAPPGSEITAYQILRRRPTLEQELLVLVENTGGTGTTYTDDTVENGVHYIYRVKAINNTVIGPISNRAEVRIPR